MEARFVLGRLLISASARIIQSSMIITNETASSIFIKGNKYNVTLDRLPEATSGSQGYEMTKTVV
jgi:hypothetical protein